MGTCSPVGGRRLEISSGRCILVLQPVQLSCSHSAISCYVSCVLCIYESPCFKPPCMSACFGLLHVCEVKSERDSKTGKRVAQSLFQPPPSNLQLLEGDLSDKRPVIKVEKKSHVQMPYSFFFFLAFFFSFFEDLREEKAFPSSY